MNTPGTKYVTGKMIAAVLDTGVNNAHRIIKQVWQNSSRYKRFKHSKVTIKEFADYHGYELNEFVDQINQKCKMNILHATK